MDGVGFTKQSILYIHILSQFKTKQFLNHNEIISFIKIITIKFSDRVQLSTKWAEHLH